MVKGWVVQSELDDAVAEARSLKKENERQDKAINEKNLQIVRAEQERDTLKLQMAPFQAIAASIYTNEPPHKRLDSLFALLQGVTNDLQALGPAAMDFRLIANDSFVTNGLVKVPTNGQLVLAARNIGKFTAENLNISISFLEATNHVLAEGWTMPGSLSGDNPGDARYPLWRVRAKDSIPTSGVFYAPPMYIQGKLDPPLDAVVLIYSHRAAVKRFVLKLSMVESNK